ncbi:MAG: ABC transporter ATP-binding protein [Firmicutes bacterium]|nr:ABC transporter ATP-binding protein [Bacillota bacterium]
MKNELLRAENVSVSVPHLNSYYEAVSDLNLVMERNDSIGLIGESGSGKTLSALALAGLLPEHLRLTSGKVYFDGVELTALNKKEMAKYRGFDITMVFQDSATSLNPLLTVGFQLREVIDLHRPDLADEKSKLTGMINSLKEVGLEQPESTLKKYPHQLSGGQRQRVMLAMAMLPKPRLLLADEPTTALDLTTQQQILELIAELQRTHDLTLLMISHNLHVVASLCRKILVMYAGRLVEKGWTHEVLEKPGHPYTEALLAAKPSFENRGITLKTIEGTVLPMEKRGLGCSFAARCPYRQDICFKMVKLHKFKDKEILCNFPLNI